MSCINSTIPYFQLQSTIKNKSLETKQVIQNRTFHSSLMSSCTSSRANSCRYPSPSDLHEPTHKQTLISTVYIKLTILQQLWHSSNGTGRYPTSDPVCTGTGDRLQMSRPPQYVTSHRGHLSLLPSVREEMSIGESVVILCGGGAKPGMASSTCG